MQCCGKEMKLNISCNIFICQNSKCSNIFKKVECPDKRLNHFKEHLLQLQANDLNIHIALIGVVKSEMIKQNISHPTLMQIKQILSKLRYQHHYDKIASIHHAYKIEEVD